MEAPTSLNPATALDQGISFQQQRSFLHRYSWGALIYNCFYYFPMGDRLFGWLSILAAIFFPFAPLLLILPFWARRRAWRLRSWGSFTQFRDSQQSWDRAALIGFVFMLFIVGAMIWISYTLLINVAKTFDPQLGGSQDLIQQLQDTTTNFQNLLGN